MGIDTTIKDGTGSSRSLKVDENNAAYVTDLGIPPEKLQITLRPFAQYLTDDGTTTGSEDMIVDGSTTVQDFYIGASPDGDRYVQTLAFTISDASASLNQWGNLSALTNGCQLIYQDSTSGDVIIADSLKTNFDFVQLCNFEPSFGTGSAAFLASNVSGASEAFVPILDISDVFGLTYGIRLPKGSDKKLILRIQDNATGIDRFDVKAFGFDRIDIMEV
jgi:hypothetical protein